MVVWKGNLIISDFFVVKKFLILFVKIFNKDVYNELENLFKFRN